MSEHEVLAASVDGVVDARLVVRRGLGNATLVGAETMAELYTARCTGRAPRARCSGGVVELTYPELALCARARTEISLNASVPWEIEIAVGASDIRADLTQLRMRSVDVNGRVARLTIDLGNPDGTLSIRLGAVDNTTIRRPSGVPVRLRIRGEARGVTLDDRSVPRKCGPTAVTTPGYDHAAHRVDISADSAVDLAVATAEPTWDARIGQLEVMAAARAWLGRMCASGVVWPAHDVA
jgi:hypothetical protein